LLFHHGGQTFYGSTGRTLAYSRYCNTFGFTAIFDADRQGSSAYYGIKASFCIVPATCYRSTAAIIYTTFRRCCLAAVVFGCSHGRLSYDYRYGYIVYVYAHDYYGQRYSVSISLYGMWCEVWAST
jgi:hypothetical protein